MPADLEHTVKFLTSTVGRDRVNRFAQYFSKYLVWQLTRPNFNYKDLAERVQKLQTVMTSTRKVMQTGRQIEFTRNIVKAIPVKDDVVRIGT